ncbi:RNase A-like domain-containing protein [Marinobacter mangrovi]|uniref:RNase A-like domain-containing protein n=1 Tax=Marinobacter mangrovi TaxID=2803918 RepID=UPI0019322D13|nr:RNase A-like domain-containing protein [Marinobacter mangrovi]
MATEGHRIQKPNGKLSKPTHSLEKHGPDVTDTDLKNRTVEDLLNKGRAGRRTTFNDRHQMGESIARILEINRPEIDDWLSSSPKPGVPKAFSDDARMGNLGRGYQTNSQMDGVEPISASMSEVNVVLLPKGDGSLLTHTAHPQ